jgi:hypothetical protein
MSAVLQAWLVDWTEGLPAREMVGCLAPPL